MPALEHEEVATDKKESHFCSGLMLILVHASVTYLAYPAITCTWEFIRQLMNTAVPYISSEHAALFGLSSLCPFSRRVERETGSTPG